ncbi:hypothetical protein [Streptomyces sp. NPDC006551]|uniref:hypothetical protein n=1 Tax=Streptomyces sp. NPDC006551 TaxID=3157178 RepID=UPI00339FA349
MSRIARVLVGTAVALALAGTAACGGGGGGDGTETTASPTETQPTQPQQGDTLGTVFPGKGGGGQAAPVRVPTAKVNQRTGGKLKFRNVSGGDVSMGDPEPQPDNPSKGQTLAGRGNCPDPLPDGQECEMTLMHTSYVAGPYSGVVTIETSEGETITVPYSGEAVENGATNTESPTTDTPLPTDPTPTDTTPTDITPTDTTTVDPGTESEIIP